MNNEQSVNSSGGAFIGGNVDTGGGKFVGRGDFGMKAQRAMSSLGCWRSSTLQAPGEHCPRDRRG